MTEIIKNNITDQRQLQFIQPQLLSIKCVCLRPNSYLKILFGNEDVTPLCNVNSEGRIQADLNGKADIVFNIPARKFHVGNYDIKVLEYDLSSNADFSFSSAVASGTFSASGYADIFQYTQSSVVTTTATDVVLSHKDAIAQSFNTNGESGGIFLSSINVYFKSKGALPVRCELRLMENGSPSRGAIPHANMVSTLSSSEVNIDNTPSKFIFNPPIHLPGDAEYCFVLSSNSNEYSLAVAEKGVRSIENTTTVTDQPRVGSMMLTKDGISWTEIPNEDIKFTINKCKFTLSGDIKFTINTRPEIATGRQFSTVKGSRVVTYTHPNAHGLQENSIFKVSIETLNGAPKYPGVLNGIDISEFNGNHVVTKVVDDNTISFSVQTPASASGSFSTQGNVTSIQVIDGGAGYLPTDTVSFIGGGGSGAVAQLNVYNGTITSVNITSRGSGFTTPPTVVVNSASGAGAVLVATVTPVFSVYVNKPYTGIIPKLPIVNFSQTSSQLSLSTTQNSFEEVSNAAYLAGSSVNIKPYTPIYNIGQNLMVVSKENEQFTVAGSENTTAINVNLSTQNSNLSPVIDLNMSPTLSAYSNAINSLSDEDVDSSVTSSGVVSIVIDARGAQYTSAPVINFSLPEQEGGESPEATISLSNGEVDSITITKPGSGYIKAPQVSITGGGGEGALARAKISPINSELNSFFGNAKSKYISKKINLSLPSKSIYLLSEISADSSARVEWYARTSLSSAGVSHESTGWRLLICNRKSFSLKFQTYTFALENISEFDTLDLKCVLKTTNPVKSPRVKSYKVITAL